MQILRQALGALGFRLPEPRRGAERTDYTAMMRAALERMHLAELQIREAKSLEELDVGRAALLAAQAEVQQLIRAAKRERGVTVRPIAETEDSFRRMRERMHGRSGRERSRRKTGTGR